MPCSCDGYEDTYLRSIADRAQRLEAELCRARSIIHRILQFDLKLPADLQRKAGAEVTALLAHKRDEIAKDLENAKASLRGLESQVRHIEGLGGEPGKAMLQHLREAKEKVEKLSHGMSDEELLG